ncbi:alpha/beta hydrolase [Corynebacterium poyangense]|uniref:Alpha/beta hydrolase n=1 Tax=Corynebacterium poyangense TaxID=2684405 RepID=A0A7H0SM91_9CORY|nr:dienelactone hydrolase family protein [Corynebacterium poyangense]MBZ8176766.1 alpha/beta hydrolase [Corynebacterium poyangense]QNQ89666.1 alpha/beta hydrolase [Corynebacterium poyangense]
MSENLKKHLSKLSKRGPHHVLVGDLDYAGLPGKVYVPAEGNGVPGIVFGHDWMKNVGKYHATLRHFASWGIAVAAPNTETGFSPDHRGFAADLESCLQIIAGVKLGTGSVTVGPGKLGLVGHGMGAGCAVLAAVDNPKVKAVAALYPAVTAPSAVAAARSLDIPGLVIGSGHDSLIDAGNPAKLAYSWRGDVAYREIAKANQLGFSEDSLLNLAIGNGKPQWSAQETARGLITGFLLHQLDQQNKYSGFSAALAEAKKVRSYVGEELAEKAGVELSSSTALSEIQN